MNHDPVPFRPAGAKDHPPSIWRMTMAMVGAAFGAAVSPTPMQRRSVR
ncbi:hypothetical protein [Brevundimonas sp. NIBR11]|nr:hypothetical protein [Brevundimonas sp. NIBR11]WGM32598.1 hypothetical protein KKHFBJBL_02852 [Brevundimonas sp. NIBR11]